jgi:glutaredoxin
LGNGVIGKVYLGGRFVMNSKKPMIILSQPECQPCLIAKMELKDRGIDFIEVDVTEDTNVMWKAFMRQNKLTTTPQVFSLVGGKDQLMEKLDD